MVGIRAGHLTIFILLMSITIIINSCKSPDSKGKIQMGLSEMTRQETIKAMVEKFGASANNRIEIGVQQVGDRWKAADGTDQDFQVFCTEYFSSDQSELDAIFDRFQKNLESLYGNLNRVSRDFKWVLDVDRGKVFPIDYLWANYSPSAHTSDDLFNTKLAFAGLVTFPIENLEQKNTLGEEWSRRKWAEVRLVEEFMTRVPAEV